MDPSSINWLAVLVAGISAFVVGGIWYSPGLFGKAWMKDSNLNEEEIKRSNKGKIFGFTAIFSLLMAANLAMYLADGPATCPDGCFQKTNLAWGTMAGFLTGIWTFCAIAIHSLFELKSWRLIFINGGYSIVALTLMGAIIGLWR
ncbi:DUF1761 domain-containing protein [Foetidibacter luteolus]|uniref:DUF1761 domain-containing protein n=1 Tax=Foetidibacter luteolus TaxID=2608880 RepID=UPI00129A118C|nr:DUF1761 domain-containing protein [Foetidibacter luteolus]